MTSDFLNNTSPPFTSHRILVVDDVPDNLNLLSIMLGEAGYEVRRAPNGNLTLQNVPRYQPHLILLDIMMPGMDGYEVCRCLKENPETTHIPIIFLSALDEPFDKIKAFQCGGSDYVTKPFDVAEVLARVKQQLSLQDLQSELKIQNSNLKAEIKKRKKAENKAFKASQAKSQFLARMSHELRTPLSTIIGYADLMLADSDRSQQDVRNLKTMLKSASHLLNLLEDVLNTTKIESGHIHILEQRFNLHGFLNDLEEMFSLQANTKDIEFRVHGISTLPQWIQTDEIKLRQVLINLISNALKFTAKGSVTLTTQAFQCKDIKKIKDTSAPESAYCCLLQFQIQDTGPGIPVQEQSLLFQPFEQTETGRLSQTGSGLGLAISRNFIRLMGGDIFVESSSPQGTCFTVEVLVKVLPETIAKDSPEKELVLLPELASVRRIALLLHNVDLRQWLPQFLKQAGYEVRSLTSEEAVMTDAWQTWNPDLLLVEPQDQTEHDRQLILQTGYTQLLEPPYRPQPIMKQVQTALKSVKVSTPS